MKKHLFYLIPLLLILFFLPQLASTPPGKRLFNQAFSRRLHANVSISRLRLSWLGPQTFHEIAINGSQLIGHVGHLRSDSPFWSLFAIGDDFVLQDGSFTFPSHGNASLKNVVIQLHHHNLEAVGDSLPQGRFTLTGKVFSKNDFDISYNLDSIPSAVLDQLFGQSFPSQLLGATFDAQGSYLFHLAKGALKLDLSSPQTTTSLRAHLDPEYLTLEQPLQIKCRLPQADTYKPITFDLSPRDFRTPWRNFDLKKTTIGQAALDLGRGRYPLNRSLRTLLSLAKGFPQSNPTEIWFAPFIFSLSKGILSLERTDALVANTFHVCCWGEANVIQNELAMTLGICADTLSHVFGIRSLPLTYVLKIPVQGPLLQPQFDTGPAALKIAALATANQLPKVGGPGGKIFGGLLNTAAKAQDNQTDVPAPKRPFPWEK